MNEREIFEAMSRLDTWPGLDGFVAQSGIPLREIRPRRLQRHIMSIYPNAYPEKSRCIFVHVPKCAGSDLRLHLAERYAVLVARWRLELRTTRDRFFAQLHNLTTTARDRDTLLLAGHIELASLVRQQLIRPNDTAVTIIRDPVDLAISAVNYTLTTLAAGDRKVSVARVIGETPDLDDPGVPRKLLFNSRQNHENAICHYLGGGDAASTLRLLARTNVEVTTVAHYAKWLPDRFGVPSDTQHNVSRKFITRAMLEPAELRDLEARTEQSRIVFDTVAEAIVRGGGTSVFGRELHQRRRQMAVR